MPQVISHYDQIARLPGYDSVYETDAQSQLVLEDWQIMRSTIAYPASKALVAIRFDDNDLTFYSVAYPLLFARRMPCTLAYVANRVGRYPWRDKMTDANAIEMADNGCEIACHSYEHLGTPTTLSEALNEVRAARIELETDLGYTVRNFVQPGSWSPVTDVTRNTLVGRVIMGEYTLFEGYQTGVFHRRPNLQRFGVNHRTGDGQTAATIKGWIDNVAADKLNLIILFHGIEEGLEAGVSPEVFEEVLDHLVMLRDAGQLEVVTDSGLMAASLGDEINHIRNGSFEDLASGFPRAWSKVGSPTLITDGARTGTNAVAVTSGNYISQTLECNGWRSPSLRVRVRHRRVDAGTTGNIRIHIMHPNGTITRSQTSTGTDWQTLEAIFSLPTTSQSVNLIFQPSFGTSVIDDIEVTRIG